MRHHFGWRKKKNRPGTTSVAIVDKSRGSYHGIRTVGVTHTNPELQMLLDEGNRWIRLHCGGKDIFNEATREAGEKQATEHLLSNIESILLNGPQLILDHVFRLIGFGAIGGGILKHLVPSRTNQPSGKPGTVEYLEPYFGEDVELHKIYRYLDKLHKAQQEKIQEISVAHTRKILGGGIGLVFYDATTLYFESGLTGELREKGWPKGGKPSQPQVVLGLLAGRDGYPLAYSLFNLSLKYR